MVERPSKTFRRIQKQREDEFIPPSEPDRSYKRVFRKTRMSWPLALIYKDRWDVLVIVILFYIGLTVVAGVVVYFGLKWLLWHFGGIAI